MLFSLLWKKILKKDSDCLISYDKGRLLTGRQTDRQTDYTEVI